MTNVVMYLRISADHKGEGDGVERQDRECREYAEAHGMTIVGVYQDNDKSATDEDVIRDDFERLLVEVPGTGYEVLTWYTDRFVRRMNDLERVIKSNLIVHAVHASTLDLASPSGRAVSRTLTAWATFEGEQKALRQKASHRQRAQRGLPFFGGHRPFGFIRNKETLTYDLHPVEAPLLAECYDALLRGDTVTELATYLANAGTTTTTGKAWSYNKIRDILEQPRNAGLLYYEGRLMGKGKWEPIVSEEIFHGAQRILSDVTRHTGGPRLGAGGILHWLVGVAECGKCGSKMHGHRQGTSKTPHYRCKRGCSSANAAWLEELAGAMIVHRLTAPVTEAQVQRTASVDELTDQLRELELKGARYADMFDEDELDLDQFRAMNKKNRARIEEVRKQINTLTLDRRLVAFTDIDDLDVVWGPMETRRKSVAAKAFFETIKVMPRGQRGAAARPVGLAEFHIRGFDEPLPMEEGPWEAPTYTKRRGRPPLAAVA